MEIGILTNNRTKSNQRWMKLRTTVQISSAIQKKPPLKREDSFLKRFSTRQIPETQVRSFFYAFKNIILVLLFFNICIICENHVKYIVLAHVLKASRLHTIIPRFSTIC